MINALVNNLNILNRAIPRVQAAMDTVGKRWVKSFQDDDQEALRDWGMAMAVLQIEQGSARRRLADECEPWFDGSAFPRSGRASDLGLKDGDDCPKCGGELHKSRHRFDDDGGAPDCDWLHCLDCNYQTDPE